MAIRDPNSGGKPDLKGGDIGSALTRLSSLALSATDPDRVISEALNEIRKTLKARMCWMFLVEEGSTILKTSGDAGSRRASDTSKLLLKFSPKTLRRGRPLMSNRVGELYRQNRALHAFLRQKKIEKFLAVPLKKDGRSIGVLNLGRGSDAPDFTQADLRSLAALGSVLVVSRLRVAESESKQAQSFLGGIVDNTPNPIFIKDRNHRYVVLNQAFSELLGHSREEMLGKSDYDFFPKDQADFFRKKDEEMFRTGKVVDIPEEPVTGKDGSLHYVHTKKAPLKDSSGKITHLVGIIEDVTERRRAEEALKESEERFRLMAETSLDYSFQTDRNGITVYCSPAVERVLGYTPEEREGMDFRSVIPRSDISKVQALFKKVMGGEAVQNLDISLHHKNGKPVAVEVSVVPIFRNKEVTGLYGIARDVTERKKAEGALRESEQKHRLLIESSDAAITLFDRNGTYLFLNSIAAKWLNGKPEDYVGKTLYDTFPKALADKFVKRFRRIIKSGVGEIIEEVVQKPLGGRFISSNLQPVRDQNGKTVGVQIVTHDITERKRADSALRESEEKHRLLVENIKEGIFSTDHGIFTTVNESMCRIFGYTKQEFIGMRSWNLAVPQTRNSVRDMFREKVARHDYSPAEVMCLRKDGSVFVAEIRLSAISRERVSLGTVSDITERRRAEKDLRESERRYRALFDGAAEGIVVADVKTRELRYANPAVCKMLGYSEEELVRLRVDDIHPRDSLKYAISEFRAQARGEKVLARDLPCLRKDGTVMYADIKTARLLIDGRKCNVGFFTDVTKRRQAEAVAEGERQRLFSVLDVMPALVYLQAPDYSVPFVNQRFRELFGDPGDRPCYESFYGRKKPCEPCTTLRVLKTRVPQTYEWTSKEGRTYMIHEDLFPGNDGTDMVLGTGIDVTEHKRIEKALIRKERVARERARVFVELHELNRIGDILTRVCKAVRDSGLFQRAVMTLHEPGGQITHIGQVGLPSSAVRNAQQAAPMDRKLKGRITSKRFRISNSFFIPREAGIDFSKTGRHIPQKKKETARGDWQPGDELFVPLRDFSGMVMGYLSVDTPADGCRPDVTTAQALEMLVEAAASRVRELRAQQALREGEERYRLLVENLTDMIVEFDTDGYLRFVSPSYCRAFGKIEEEILGKKFMPLIHKDDRENVKKALAGVYEPPHVAYVEERAKTVDGWRWQSWVNTAVLDESGHVVRIIAVGRDITDRKRAEEALRKSEERFRTFMETASDLMNITDEKGNITYVNESMAKTLGYSKGTMIGMHITQLLTKEALEKDFEPNWGKFVADGKISIGTTFAAEDGKEIYGELKAVATYDKDGKFAGTRAVFHDLTERRQVEEKLLESEIKYRTLVEQLPAVTYTAALDESSTTLYISPQIEKILGISPAEYKADPDFWVKHLYPDDRDRVLNELSRSHRSGQPFNSEYRMVTQNGQLVWFRDDATVVRDDKGNPLYLQGVMFDITERKQAEEALQRSENRYRGLFEDSPISLWEEDFSEVKKYIDRLRHSGVSDFRSYFEKHPKGVAKCASMVKVIDVNRASLRLYRARNKENLKSGLARIFARESYYPFTEELIAVAEGKTRFQKDADIRTLRRETRHVSVTWSVAPGHEDTLSKVVVAITDVTEAKEAEDALRRSEEMHRTLVETAQEGIGIVDSKENLVFVNRAFAGMLGYRKDELLGKNLQEISPETQYDAFRQETKKRKQGKPSRYEITLLTRKRKPKPMYVSAAPLWNADGSFRGTLGVVSDLTEIKKAREYNVLLGASRSLSRTLKFDQVLKLGAEKMTQALNADRCTVMLPGEAGAGSSTRVQLHPFPSKKKGPLSASILRTPKELLSSYKRSLRAQASIQIPDLGSDLAPDLGKKIMRKSGMVSALAVPMFSRNTMLGVFHVGMRKKTRAFSLEEEQLARTMANQVSVALQNCKLMEDLRKEHARIIEQTQLLSAQYREQKMMFELTQTLSSSRHLDHLLASAAKKVTEFLKTERGSIALLDPQEDSCRLRAVHVQGEPRNRRSEGFTFTFGAYPGLKTVLREHKPFILQDTSSLPKEGPVRRYFLSQGIKSTVAVPLISRGKCLGFLTAASMTEVHHFTEEEIRLLQTISNPVAVTIENYRLMEDLKQKLVQIRQQTQTLEKQTHEQEILLRVSQALSRAMDLDEVSQVGSRVVGSALGAERCAVCLVGGDGQHFEVRGLYSKEPLEKRKLLKMRFPWNDVPNVMRILKRGKPFFIDSTSEFPSKSKTREHFRKTGIKTALGTGMFFGKKLVGLLSVTGVSEPRVFSPEETRLIQTMANQIAVAVENARLQQVVEKHAQELKDLYAQLLDAQENERKKIAQELHDQVGQMLQAMKMNLDWVKQALTSKPEKLEKMQDWLSDTEELLAQTIEDIRDLTFELRPSVLDDFGLIPGLEWYIDIFGRRSGVKVSLRASDREYGFPPQVVTALYRIIQEALTNVAKHARASLASVSVSQRGSTAVLSVRDNGIGFDSAKWHSAPKGMGLLNIKERVDMLGGSFEIISRPRKGTKLNIQIPFSGGAV